jgi:hypothetical protein
MSAEPTEPIAMHGVAWSLPGRYGVALTAGTWARGRIVVTDRETAPLVLGWERRGVTPEPGRTSRALAARLGRDLGAGAMRIDGMDGGALVAVQGRTGTGHGAWRHLPGAGAVLTVRQTGPGGPEPVLQAVAAASAVADGEAASWRIHGLRADLPPWWRLQGVECVAGLARGVWLLRRPGRLRTEAALVVRRWGLAGRMLAGRPVAEWLRSVLDPGEAVLTEEERDGVVRLATRRAGPDWWSRLRGRRRERILWAWLEAPDRLVVQEWAGSGEPVPPAAVPALPASDAPGGSRARE